MELCEPLEMGLAEGGGTQQVSCCRIGDEIRGLDLEEPREQ